MRVPLRPSKLLSVVEASVAATALASLLAAHDARAEQAVVIDTTYVHDTNNITDKGQHKVAPAPTNPKAVNAPVDYSKGTVHAWVQVLEKPSEQPVLVRFCLQGPGHMCGIPTMQFTKPGIYTSSGTVAGDLMGEGGAPNWSSPVTEVLVIPKRTLNEGGLTASVAGGSTAIKQYFPMKMRVVITLVSAGATYVPPDSPGGAPSQDAGAPSIDAGKPEPAPAVDTGAASGSGGSSGSTAGTSGGSTVPPRPTSTAGSTGAAPADASNAGSKGAAGLAPSTGQTSGEGRDARSSGGGCAVGGGSTVAHGLSLAALGVACLLRRRRRQARA
jgi:hypothetical protein